MRAILVVLLFAGPALADGKKGRTTAPAPKTAQPAPPAPAPVPSGLVHREGEYGGVIPGQPQTGAGRPTKMAPKGTLSWIGFEVKTGVSEIFFQSAAPFELEQHVDGAALVVHLGGVNRLGHNVWRPIDTRFFDTTIARIVARQVGAARATKTAPAHTAGIDVRVAFKTAKDAREGAVRTATEADGMYYAYLSFEGAASVPTSTTGSTVKDVEQ
jgi:hypothetical protein